MQRTFVKIPEKEYGRNREQLVREDERTADRDKPGQKRGRGKGREKLPAGRSEEIQEKQINEKSSKVVDRLCYQKEHG